MSKRFDAMASAKIFSGRPEETPKNLAMIKYPALASVKYDGWRMFEYAGEVRLRSLKPPKNEWTRAQMKELFKASASLGVKGLDGEAIPGDPYDHNAMQACTSAFNCNYREAPFGFFVFDSYQYAEQPFSERLKYATEAAHKLRDMGWDDRGPVNVQPVEHVLVTNQEELFAYYDGIIARGLEGVMGRHPDAPYKYGRSTMKESWLWALKPYMDSEAEIIGFEEMLENQNELTTNERGYASRQGLKENLVPKGMLGKFVCRDEVKFPGKVFRIGMGVGLTHALRQYVWDHQEEFLGEFIKYKFQAVGVLDLPRQPKYMSFRDKRDMARFV